MTDSTRQTEQQEQTSSANGEPSSNGSGELLWTVCEGGKYATLGDLCFQRLSQQPDSWGVWRGNEKLTGGTVLMPGASAAPFENRVATALAPHGITTDGLGPVLEWMTARAEEAKVEEEAKDADDLDSEVAAIEKALLEEPSNAWDAEGEAREPIPGGCDLLLRGIPVLFFGPTGGGKTSAGLTAAMNAAMEGEKVLYLDRENGGQLTRDRMLAACEGVEGFDEDVLRKNFIPMCWPNLSKEWTPEAFGEFCERNGFTIVLFDNVRECNAQLGLGANSSDDFSVLLTLFVTPLVKRRITPLFFDNVGHKNQHRASGTAAKDGATPQVYKVKEVASFSPTRQGTIEVECTRSRYGDKKRKWRMGLGAGLWEVPTFEFDKMANSTNERILAALLGYDQSAEAVAEKLEIGRTTLNRHVEEINEPPEHDWDDELEEEFEPPIIVTKGRGTKPTMLRLIPS